MTDLSEVNFVQNLTQHDVQLSPVIKATEGQEAHCAQTLGQGGPAKYFLQAAELLLPSDNVCLHRLGLVPPHVGVVKWMGVAN